MNWLKMEKNLPIDLQDGDGYSDSFLKSKILNSFIHQIEIFKKTLKKRKSQSNNQSKKRKKVKTVHKIKKKRPNLKQSLQNKLKH